jgi:hypothetical protein
MIFVSLSIEKIWSPALTVPLLSHLTYCTPTKSDLFLADALAISVSDPQLNRLINIPRTISHVPFPLLRLYQRIRPGPRQVYPFRKKSTFYDEELLAPRPTPKLEDRPLSAVRDCLFIILPPTLHTEGGSSIRNLRTRHAVVTGTHLSWIYVLYGYNYIPT